MMCCWYGIRSTGTAEGGNSLRSLLITLMLIITVVLVYAAAAEGDGGLKNGVSRSGGAMSQHIREMSP
jgi:hypothetical protein